ncbi:trypsin-like peptidase domain-containing protein [Georgenia sp. H159]|uniref:trypsin-like peptidase domain-containing protein n=1 Tax=Georgenia sp. H159 TaxID=3076115 RepID=UPI002D79EDC6|nr:trypsin-like peptidase domain-containing protein [Georgenia sp. H159]
MNERPGEHEPGYPPSPAPRTEPYSSDDPLATAAAEGADAPGTPSGATGGATRPLPGTATPPGAADDATRPLPATATADGAADGVTRPFSGTRTSWGQQDGPAVPGGRDDVPSGPLARAGGSAPGQAWYGGSGRDGGLTAQQGRDAPARHGQHATDASRPAAAGLPWSSPGPSGDGTPHYPPSSPPAEFTTSGGSAASPAAEPYAWRDPAARPWQSPAGYPPPPEDRAVRDRRTRRRTVGLGVVVLLVLVSLLGGVVLGALGARALWPTTTSGALPAPANPASTVRAPDSVAGIAAAALDSTVFIEVRGGGSGSSGSGMVLREDGYVVTNNHVIDAAGDGDGEVSVTFADGAQERADIVGRTADYDLAVLKVDRDGLTPLPLADSDAVVVGDPVVAVGAPLGLEGTVTSGIISALNRPVQAGGSSEGTSFINAIQTDAAINPGNSGGPLINTAGEVIGINTAIAQAGGQPTGSIGLGFAIPSNQVRRTAEQLIETGRATYPVIGVALDTRYQGEGVQVLEDGAADTPAVTPDGPGAEAGIEPGDVITHFDGQPVTSPSELIVAVRSRAPGDTVVLTVRSDDGQEREVEVVLDEAGSE